MRLAIVGSRNFNNFNSLLQVIERYFWHDSDCLIELIISGGAKGADSLAQEYAEYNEIPIRTFLPKWNEYGKSAGFKRNQQIVDACDMVLAFWDGESKGTRHTITLAQKAKKPTFIVYF